jgi:hypothetical protein
MSVLAIEKMKRNEKRRYEETPKPLSRLRARVVKGARLAIESNLLELKL